jgi:hypothetical protein
MDELLPRALNQPERFAIAIAIDFAIDGRFSQTDMALKSCGRSVQAAGRVLRGDDFVDCDCDTESEGVSHRRTGFQAIGRKR